MTLPPGLEVEARSLVRHDGSEYALAHTPAGLRLAVLAPEAGLTGFEGECARYGGRTLLMGPLSGRNAAGLRAQLPWLCPRPLGLRTSAGMGDRLGLATPGHVRAVRLAGGSLAPIFAQQSIREMARTGRTPQQVMDDATWGVFQEGWRDDTGADADHLKAPADISRCLAAGFTFFTIDPGDYVDARAEHATPGELEDAAAQLPVDLQPQATGLRGRTMDIEGNVLHFDDHTLLKAVVKYGRAVAHIATMHRHLVATAGQLPYELEVSVDETEEPTAPAEHVYLASELRRLGVRWISLAPRFVGRFEKGVDYISPDGQVGNAAAFEADFAVHAAIARQFGPYKLSLHSGSDKFSIYAAAACLARGLVHLKTAGTSYLEALRTTAVLEAALFREIYSFARERYEQDRASYHVSARLERAPEPDRLAAHELPALLDQFDAREILHVTYGSVLTARDEGGALRFQGRLMDVLRGAPDAYARCLERHFARHLTPFAQTG